MKISVYLLNNVIALLEVWKKTESKNPKVAKTKNGRIMLLSKSAVSNVKTQDLSKSKKLVDYLVA